MPKTEVKIEGKGKDRVLVIRMPLMEPRESASGKTMVVASTGGNQPVECEYDGKQLVLGLNAYYRKER